MRAAGWGLAPVAALFALAAPAPAEDLPVAGYFQTVGIAGTRGDLLQHFNRLRLSTDVDLGPLRLDAAYEHTLSLSRSETTAGFGLGSVPSGGEWLDLQWTLREEGHAVWRHRFDRLHLSWEPNDDLVVTVGRQAISWGTTLFLSPADPFRPFHPVDPFRQFRAGVDAVRVRYYPGALSEFDVVVSRSGSPSGPETTALARGLATVKGWEISGWAGSLYGDAAVAAATSGALGAWAVRGEAVLRRVEERVALRSVVGVDRRFRLMERDLTVAVEYQLDGLGLAGEADLVGVLGSASWQRGELQVLGRHTGAASASWQLHPLWTAGALLLANLTDPSALVGPSLGFSAGENASLAAGAFFGLGDDRRSPAHPLPSEYGLAGATAYLSLSWFF